MDHNAINSAFDALTKRGMHIRTPMSKVEGDVSIIDAG